MKKNLSNKKQENKTQVKDDSHLVEIKVTSEQVFSGKFLKVFRDEVRLPDGNPAHREYLTHPGAAMIIPVLGDNVLMVRQYRYSVGQVFLEFPAGKIDRGETSLQTAQRELLEETGLKTDDIRFVQRIHPVIGYSNEYIDIYISRNHTRVQSQLDHGEFVEAVELPMSKVLKMAEQGELTDVKTLIGVLLLPKLLPEKQNSKKKTRRKTKARKKTKTKINRRGASKKSRSKLK